MSDAVNKPDHYQTGGIETIDVIRAKLGPQGFGYYCEGNVMKYLTRWRTKDGLQDLKKARVYLDWLLIEAELEQVPRSQRATGGAGEALAARQFDEAEAGNPLNTADTVGPGEA